MGEDGAEAAPRDAERMKFFTDAVVAIAMTLLILPLLESVAEGVREHLSTSEFLGAHRGQLLAFLISFVVIAGFWVNHERLYGFVDHWTGPLMVLNIGWMLTIVFLPVATALTAMRTDDLQVVLYVGTMLVNSVLMGAMSVVVRVDRRVHGERRPSLGGVSATAASITLFAVALVVALLLPADDSYYGLLAMFLVGPLQALYERLARRRYEWD